MLGCSLPRNKHIADSVIKGTYVIAPSRLEAYLNEQLPNYIDVQSEKRGDDDWERTGGESGMQSPKLIGTRERDCGMRLRTLEHHGTLVEKPPFLICIYICMYSQPN